ncbi:MAG: DNA repair protein RecN [Gammaproteobacteria bacterium]
MLSAIHIRNLAIVDEIDVELDNGMTTLTGETGAGKSILVDALGLVLGDRSDSAVIRHGRERAEISASFDISGNPGVSDWLHERDMDADGDCQLRRIISRTGRSRGYINGQPAPMQQLRELGEQLVDIHGQHEHQSLLRAPVQRQLLDAFGGHHAILDRVTQLYVEWRDARDRLLAIVTDDAERTARQDLLRYQLQELESLGMTAADIESVDAEHARLANAGRLLSACQAGLQRLDADDGDCAITLLSRTLEDICELATLDRSLAETAELLGEAAINIQEGITSLRRYSDGLELDPERLQWLEERIGLLHDLARKHQCRPTDLPAVGQRLREELDAMEHAGELRADLEARVAGLESAWHEAATELTRQRQKAARTFGREITDAMQTLGMAGGVFEAAITPRRESGCSTHGQDDIVFQVSANPGLPLQPLARVASGGELSRISLSIQVISAGEDTIPTLIFDEVDSGIGGGVAEIVGRKLRALASERQVLCVTHLPQVAALAHHQLQVTKSSASDTTTTCVQKLDREQRVNELARMLGGVKITRQTRDHAREMMQQAATSPKSGRRKSRKAIA